MRSWCSSQDAGSICTEDDEEERVLYEERRNGVPRTGGRVFDNVGMGRRIGGLGPTPDETQGGS